MYVEGREEVKFERIIASFVQVKNNSSAGLLKAH
jgi:hypothetical protein